MEILEEEFSKVLGNIGCLIYYILGLAFTLFILFFFVLELNQDSVFHEGLVSFSV